ncbi:MAG: arsenosugar biosynthesis radical SAM protein ArsS [Gammaproteobacteria bacterium]|nr:arsenosugar biosynthesis radical SAM protein ArsS [Gammaproteobacteria bacterium]
MLDSSSRLIASDFPTIYRESVATLQINLGYKCNQSCVHCHVAASPYRTEMMTANTAEEILDVVDRLPVTTIDLTGGAPELNPNFRTIVVRARRKGLKVIDRCNLSILFEPEQEDLGSFLAREGVVIVASLPCYLEGNVDQQRGKGVHSLSIRALRWLNDLGYGTSQRLELNLVYNPLGAVLPPPQKELEAEYKRELRSRYSIEFNRLFTLTNMPINRFGSTLISHNKLEEYVSLLKANYREENLCSVMCRNTLSVDWRGYLYDCDFNQMLGMGANSNGSHLHIRDLINGYSLSQSRVRTAEHCYGCTAGQGSSCEGALV